MENKKNEILEAIKKQFPDIALAEEIDENLLIVNIVQFLEREGIINFTFEYRENESDDWLQCEYWSEKIKKAIIFDYDAPKYFDNQDINPVPAIEIMARTLAEYQEKITALEESITIKERKTQSDLNIERLAPNNKFKRENAIELASEFFSFEGMNFDENGDETESAEEVENKAIDFLKSACFELID